MFSSGAEPYLYGMETKLEKEWILPKGLRHVTGFVHNGTLGGFLVIRVEKCVLIIEEMVLYFIEEDFWEKKGINGF